MKLKPFKNEAYTDFSKIENKKKMENIISKIEKELGKEYPIIIGGEKIKTNEKFTSYNPSNKDEACGIFQKADTSIVDKAIDVAIKTFETWRFVPPIKRAFYLLKAAKILRKRKLEFAAYEILEVGKTWLEADADVAEAIDFCEFYAREMIRYSAEQPLTKIKDEKNELVYIPLGVGAIIPPWNFPLAILVGMTSAAFVTGNTLILKPSSDSPLVAYKFMEVLEEIGLPAGVVNFVTGPGSIAGDYLVSHSKTRFIAFTGSKEVGLRIVELAGKTQPGQIWIKRVIAEMGGKNAIIIDESANLDDAANGVKISAYGFQGQKCSACSRAIVLEKIYDKFLEKLIEKVKSIKVGPAKYYENDMGPVINEKAYKSILEYIEIGKKEGKLILGGNAINKNGYFIEPTIFVDVSSKARIAQEEIFGPVLAVIKAKDFDEALQIANDSEYGLTGSVYTKNRKNIEKAKKLFHVGNLYINRKSTGALVGVHPFGGFNMSGTDSKAGGRDYLLLFLQAKSISEKIKVY
jgi:1-pyrroline-5-carboxylate dehydrogenase